MRFPPPWTGAHRVVERAASFRLNRPDRAVAAVLHYPQLKRMATTRGTRRC
jgi:hypothetical protein